MLETWPASVNYITQDNNDSVYFWFDGSKVCYKYAVTADRIMKFIDENELNYI